MTYWETAAENPELSDFELEFAHIWKGMPKVVFSSTLTEVQGNATLATDSVTAEVARLKQEPGKDLTVGGAGLASTLVELDLVDEYRMFVRSVVLGGGTPYLPSLKRRLELELLETRAFGSRVVYLRYRRVRAT